MQIYDQNHELCKKSQFSDFLNMLFLLPRKASFCLSEKIFFWYAGEKEWPLDKKIEVKKKEKQLTFSKAVSK